MNLETIQMPKTEARRAFLEYRDAVHDRRRTGRQEEAIDVQLMRAYRALARGQQLVRLTEAIANGGTTSLEHTRSTYRGGVYGTYTDELEVPLLAVARADSAYVYTDGIRKDGSLEYRDRETIAPNNRRARVSLETGTFEPADRYALDAWSANQARAIVPLIPPLLRPKRGSLGNYHVLWGPVEWAMAARPRPPGDPALLKHIDGDLYAVVAVWDLTPLEQAVLGGIRG